MTDFTSSLYLGMKHASAGLPEWRQLTTGVPAALAEPVQSKCIGQQVAQLQGLQKGMAAPSTLHLYHDLYGMLSHRKITLFMDEKVYPVSEYGLEKLMVNHIPIHRFRHHDAGHLQELIRLKCSHNRALVVITDGWCTPCGKPAPVDQYAAIVQDRQGIVVIDDTQAFGILGQRTNGPVYGHGGGGILRWLNVHDHNVVTIVSLAKAFGVPMAVISGNASFIQSFNANSQTSVNSSPVSPAHLSAGLQALSVNTVSGDERRFRLWSNVRLLKDKLARSGIVLQGGIFPVQLMHGPHRRLIQLHEYLMAAGIRTVLVAGHGNTTPELAFIIRYDHSTAEIKMLAGMVQQYHCRLKPSFYNRYS